jgi:hypothetical protein
LPSEPPLKDLELFSERRQKFARAVAEQLINAVRETEISC